MQLATVCLYASDPVHDSASKFTIPTTVVALITTASLAVLSLLHHPRSHSPCSAAQSFLFITLLLDSARLRSTWLTSSGDAIAFLYVAGFASKALLLVIESLHKTRHCIDQRHVRISPEETAGVFSRSLMLWLVPLFLRGYRAKLTMEDLHHNDEELDSEKVTDALAAAWLSVQSGRRRRLALALGKAFAGSLALVHIPRLALVAFALTQPLLITAALSYVQDHAGLSLKYGQALVGAFALNYVAIAVRALIPTMQAASCS